MSDVINDAEAYGVEIVPAKVEPGQPYWKVVSVHHLTPEENYYRHYIFLDAVNEAGERLYGTIFTVTWDGGSDTVIVDKRPPDAGTDFPIWKWQVCSVEAMGAPSDRVVNLRTDHPTEGNGNDMFRHSFAITYLRTTAEEALRPAVGSLMGGVPGGGGHTIELTGPENQSRTMVVGIDEQYRFTNLEAGSYILRDLSDHRVVGPLALNGEEVKKVDFPLPLPSGRTAARYFLFEHLSKPNTRLYLSLLSDYLATHGISFGFDISEASFAVEVCLVGEHTQETIDALNAAGCQVVQLPLTPRELLNSLTSS